MSGFQVPRNAATEQKVVATEGRCAGGHTLRAKTRCCGALDVFLLVGVAWESSNGFDGMAFVC